MRKSNFIQIAESLAHESGETQKHGALIVNGGSIIASGYNRNQTNHTSFFKKLGFYTITSSIHAETAAVYSLLSSQRSYWVLRREKSKERSEGSSKEAGYLCSSNRFQEQ